MSGPHRFIRVESEQQQAAARSSTGGGREYATVVVAAVDSHESAKATADYVCDGVADDDEIQEAIYTIGSTGGGRIILLEGTYDIANGITINVQDRIVIEGQGPGTRLRLTDNTTYGYHVFDSAGATASFTIRKMQLDGNKSNQAPGNFNAGVYLTNSNVNVTIEDVEGHDFTYTSFYSETGDGLRIRRCSAFNDDQPVQFVGYRERLNVSDLYIQNCGGFWVDRANYSTFRNITVADTNTDISNNGAGIRISSCAYCTFVNLVSSDTWSSLYDPHGIYLDSNYACIFMACRSNVYSQANAMMAYGNDNIVIAGAYTERSYEKGIELLSTNNSLLVDSSITWAGQGLDNTYDGIFITGGSSNCVQGNTVRHGGSTIQQRVGLNVASGSDHFVTNNDLKDSGRTTSFNDSATGTITAPGNQV